MIRRMVNRHGFMAFCLAIAAFVILSVHGQELGTTRDESFYFSAAESYAGWFRELWRDPENALSDPVIQRYYDNNHEHPVLVKNLMALSILAFGPDASDSPGRYTRNMRIPTQALNALGIALIYLFGVSVASRRVGLLAALLFLFAPRHFFHSHLACFDMPITVMTLAVVMAYRKSLTSLGWVFGAGVVFGLALATKHNAFFLPAILGLHWLVTEGKNISLSRSALQLPRIPWAFLSMLIIGPALFWAHWPYLWHQTIERLGWYFGFHLNHVHYPWEYLGTLLTEPPFPWAYPFVVTALTLPLPTLLLGVLGFAGVLIERLRLRTALPLASRPEHPWLKPSDGWLVLINAFVPVFIIALPSVPIFGGVKHWLPAMPFFCLLAALALDRLVRLLPVRMFRQLGPQAVFALAAILVFLPSLQGTIRIGPYGTSFYNEAAGFVRGGADLGMQRQYWSNNVSGVLPWLNANLPSNARLYLHEVTGESFWAYQRDGFLRADVRMAWSVDSADFVAYQYHREFADTEYQIWQWIGHKTPLHGLYLDEVPLVLVYDVRKNHRS